MSASADPQTPIQPLPAPATVTVTVTPDAATPNASAASQAVPAEQTPPAGPATILATTAAAAPAASITPATSGTIAEFLKEKGVAMEPEKSQGFTALNIVLPMPPGWTVVPDPNVPDAFSVIADRQGGDGLYTSNAQLVVCKLVGEFDPREAISHGYVDSQQLFAWQTTDASMSEFGGFPSSVIEGTYRENDLTLKHLAPQRDRPIRSQSLSGGVVCDDECKPGRRDGGCDRCDRQRLQGECSRAIPAAAPAAAAPAAAAPPAAAMTAPAATAAAGALPAAANPAAVGAPATILVPAPQR